MNGTTEIALCRCADCCAEVAADKVAKTLDQIDSLAERLTPGDEVPAGECECGAFVYVINSSKG